jgi:hypothetical protein
VDVTRKPAEKEVPARLRRRDTGRVSTGSLWFAPVSQQHALTGPFLTRARELAPDLLGPFVASRLTGAQPARWIGDRPGVVLTVLVPGFDSGRVHLQVTLHDGRLTGRWAHDRHVPEPGPVSGPDTLVVTGDVEARAGESAQQAVVWMARQLARPVVEERWLGWRGPVASRTVMGDTRTVLWHWGDRWIRRFPPHQVFEIRPEAVRRRTVDH